MIPAVITFSASGAELAMRIAAATGGRVHHCGSNGENPQALLPRLFHDGTPIVGICAAGILIRILAPHLADKREEPPVLAVSSDGKSVVPLLGGHHGANQLTRWISEALGAHAALTTASDSKFTRGLDEPPDGWELSEEDDAKPAMMSLLVGAKIAVEGHAPWIAEAGYPVSSMGAVKVLVTEQKLRVDRGLVYHPKTLVAGVGCERGADPREVIELIDFALKRDNLSPQSLVAIASIDIKADEVALHAAAKHFNVPLRLFTVAELNQERYRLTNPSAAVEAEVGTPSVAEAAALKAGAIAVQKLKSARATCAIGKAQRPINPDQLGRPPGILHIVGIGPGEPAQRTISAVRALDTSSDWVGYGLYLDLIADLKLEQAEHRFHLGDEEARVRHALELAATGKQVSLVCSGDGQIYAMAALVYELLEVRGDRAVSDAARRIGIEAHPGISAFQAASAAAGALIGHDFCCISLSDLLTPREEIIKRLDNAAEADFVTALYNPRSQTRSDLIVEAKARLLFHRRPDTPVIVAQNLGRPEQKVDVVELASFDPQSVDMLTIVVIGASTSKMFKRGDGQAVAFTPRGYSRKPMLDYQAQLAAQRASAPAAPSPVAPPPPPAPAPMPSSVSAPIDITPLPAPPPPAPIPPNPAPRNSLRAGLDFLRNRARGAQLPPEKAGADDDRQG
jgi:cobalt-precorrin 5A hydrolase/precorrin-3B C17-methyltransferase